MDLPPAAAVAQLLDGVLTIVKGFLAAVSDVPLVTLGTPFLNRTTPAHADVVGCFVNALPVSTRVAESDSLCSLAQRVAQTVEAVLEHQEAPFDQVVRRLNRPRSPLSNPLFDAMVVFTGDSSPALALTGVHAEPLALPWASDKLDLCVWLAVMGESVHLRWEYATTAMGPLAAENQPATNPAHSSRPNGGPPGVIPRLLRGPDVQAAGTR